MYEVFEQLLQKFNVTTYQVSKATGISQSTLSNWKARRNLISGKNAQLIADYFGVSVDYLMTGKEKEGGEKYYLNEETSQLADYIFHNKDLRILMETSRNCDDATIKRLITIAKALKDTKDVD